MVANFTEITPAGSCPNTTGSACVQNFRLVSTPSDNAVGSDPCALSGEYSPTLNIFCRAPVPENPCLAENPPAQAVFETVVLTRGGCGAITLNSTEEGLVQSLGVGAVRQPFPVFFMDAVPYNISLFGLLMNVQPLGLVPTCYFFVTQGSAALSEVTMTVPSAPTYDVVATPAYYTSGRYYQCRIPSIILSQDVLVRFSYTNVYDPNNVVPPAAGLTFRLVATAPIAVLADFSSTCADVLISFNEPTFGNLTGVPCDLVFSSYPPDPDCMVSFQDTQTMVVATHNVSIGFVFTFLPNLIGGYNQEYTLYTNGSVDLVPSANPPAPLILMQAPQDIGPCMDYTVDLSGSQNSGGRPLTYVSYSLVSIDGPLTETAPNITAILDAASQEGALVFTIPRELFDDSQLYTFQVTVENFCGGISSLNFSVYRFPFDLPQIILPPLTVTTRNNPLLISAQIVNVCPFSATIANMSWTSGDPTLDALLPPLDGRSSQVMVPPFSFQLGRPYTFSLRLQFNDSFFENTIVTQNTAISVVIQTPSLSFAGGYRQTLQRGTPLTLTAVINDPDFPAGFINSATLSSYYTISWSCVDRDTGLPCAFQGNAGLPTGLNGTIPSILILSSRLAVTVTATKFAGNITQVAYQAISIVNQPVLPATCLVQDPNPTTNSEKFSITCAVPGTTSPAGYLANMSSINSIPDYIGVPLAFSLLPMNTPSVIMPFSTTPLGTYTLQTPFVPASASSISVTFKVAPNTFSRGSTYAFDFWISGPGYAPVEFTFVVPVKGGPRGGSCAFVTDVSAPLQEFSDVLSVQCQNWVTDPSSELLLFQLVTQISPLTLFSPNPLVSSPLPSGVFNISVIIMDATLTTVTVPIGMVTVVENSQSFASYFQNITADFGEYQDSVSALAALQLLLQSSLAEANVAALEAFLVKLLATFPTPDYALIGPFLADIVSEVATLLQDAVEGNSLGLQRRDDTDFSTTSSAIIQVDELFCQVSSMITSMDSTAVAADTCFSTDVFLQLTEGAARLLTVRADLNVSFVSTEETNMVFTCYKDLLSSLCNCMARNFADGQQATSTNATAAQMACAAVSFQFVEALCDSFNASFENDLGTLSTTCTTMPNFLGYNSTTLIVDYIIEGVYGLTISAGDSEVHTGASFVFYIPLDETAIALLSLNYSAQGEGGGLYAPLCVFYDESGWNSSGCDSELQLAESRVKCTCYHLSDFSVVVSSIPPIVFNENYSHPILIVIAVIGSCLCVLLILAGGFITYRYKNDKRTKTDPKSVDPSVNVKILNDVLRKWEDEEKDGKTADAADAAEKGTATAKARTDGTEAAALGRSDTVRTTSSSASSSSSSSSSSASSEASRSSEASAESKSSADSSDSNNSIYHPTAAVRTPSK